MKLKIQPSKIDLILATLMYSIYPSFTKENKLDITKLSNIEEVGQKYLVDPLVHSRISVSLFKSFYASGLFAIENAKSLNIPTLLIHGDDDEIVDLEGSKEFTSKAYNAELKIYSDTKHELHNDNKAKEVLEFVSSWFEGK